jgi:hypothetical protein
MLPSALKYLYSVGSVRMHFTAKQPCTNDTVCNAAMLVAKGLKNKSEVSGHILYRPPEENSFKLKKINKIVSYLKWHYNFTVGITESLITIVTKGRIH